MFHKITAKQTGNFLLFNSLFCLRNKKPTQLTTAAWLCLERINYSQILIYVFNFVGLTPCLLF